MGAIGGRTLAAVLLAAVVALAGACTGEDPPPPTPTTASSDPTTPAPTTSAPPEPETPQAFIRRWVDIHRKMQNTGDTVEFRAVSKGCDACLGLADTVEKFYAKGGYIKTAGWTIERIRSEHRSPRRAVFRVYVRSAPTEYKASRNTPVQYLSGGATQQRFELSLSNTAWNLSDLSQYAT